jgi:hypothetical protein
LTLERHGDRHDQQNSDHADDVRYMAHGPNARLVMQLEALNPIFAGGNRLQTPIQ